MPIKRRYCKRQLNENRITTDNRLRFRVKNEEIREIQKNELAYKTPTERDHWWESALFTIRR